MNEGKKMIRPSNSEIEVLEVLWDLKKATVREIYAVINSKKPCVYTSTLKTMQKMTAKKLIGRTEENQKHEYFALAEESKVKNSFVADLINKFFKGSYTDLALHALGNVKEDEGLDELTALVTKLTDKKL